MVEPGIFAITRLAAALLGTAASLPGGTGIPEAAMVDAGHSGYEFELLDASGGSHGMAISSTPLAVDLAEISRDFLNAVIATEDHRFLEHPGIDPAGTLGALADTVLRGRPRGGSGLAQQMVKNTLTGAEISLSRKAVEAMLAIRAVDALGHREVLRRYLQRAWFGRGRTGVMAAPRAWFGKEWRDITLAEAATLAAMLKGPSRYDPWRNPDATKERRDLVITLMVEKGWVDDVRAEQAKAEPVTALPPVTGDTPDPWAAMAARREMERLGLSGRGTAELSISPEWQAIAVSVLGDAIRSYSEVKAPRRLDAARIDELLAAAPGSALPRDLRASLPPGSNLSSYALLARDETGLWTVTGPAGQRDGVRIANPHPGWSPAPGEIVTGRFGAEDRLDVRLPTAVEGALVAIDPRSGEILATVGGADADLTWFDRTEAIRPPGSAIKPFLYAAALNIGLGPWTPLEDREVTYISGGQTWRPRNYDRRELGTVPMHAALERSLNVATVQLADRIGIGAMAEMAEAAGAYPPGGMVRVLPAALGASATTLRSLVSGYGAIVNEGIPTEPHIIRTVNARTGERLGPDVPDLAEAITFPEATEDLLAMLRGVVVRGTASGAFRDAPVAIAGKTGTSQDHRDAWFVGVTPHLAIGAWVGRDDNQPLPGRSTGGANAAPIVASVLEEAFAAGLIDELGYRDDDRSRVAAWPPEPHGEMARGGAGDTVASNGEGNTSIPDRNGDIIEAIRESGFRQVY